VREDLDGRETIFEGREDVDKPTPVQRAAMGCRLGYVRVMQAKGKQDRRRVTGKNRYVLKVIRFKQGRGYGS
jgi:hypothetical protein